MILDTLGTKLGVFGNTDANVNILINSQYICKMVVFWCKPLPKLAEGLESQLNP